MSVDWDQFQRDIEERSEAAKNAIDREVKAIRELYESKFAKAQEAAIEAREPNAGIGETPKEFVTRIAAVPGSFSDDAQSASEVVNIPAQQDISQPGEVTPVSAPEDASGGEVSTGQSSVVITPEPPLVTTLTLPDAEDKTEEKSDTVVEQNSSDDSKTSNG